MKKGLVSLLLGASLLLVPKIDYASDWRIPLLFDAPRKSEFTIKNPDLFDRTTIEHYFGSAFLTVSLNEIFKGFGVENHRREYAALTTFSLGLLKEFEDGYREGWSWLDMTGDVLGVGTGYMFTRWIDKYQEELKKKIGIEYSFVLFYRK